MRKFGDLTVIDSEEVKNAILDYLLVEYGIHLNSEECYVKITKNHDAYIGLAKNISEEQLKDTV